MIEAIKDDVAKKGGVKFPKLMISNEDRIVLFIEPEYGIVVDDPNRVHAVGYAGHSWIMEDFENYKGSITLQNVKENK